MYVIQPDEAWLNMLFSFAMYQVSPTYITAYPRTHVRSHANTAHITWVNTGHEVQCRGQSDTEDKAAPLTLLIDFSAACKSAAAALRALDLWGHVLGSSETQFREATQPTQDLCVSLVFFQ